jgi:hypothetical protein
MPRHRKAGVAALLRAGVLVTGCGTRTVSSPSVLAGPNDKAAIARNGSTPERLRGPETSLSAAAATAVGQPAPRIRIAPERVTITSDDPGLQLLVSRETGDGTIRDLTSRVAWRVDPERAATIEPGGYLRPLQGERSRSSPRRKTRKQPPR